MSKELNYSEKSSSGNREIFLKGEVDIYTSQNLKERLYAALDETSKDIRINCTELTYIDSTGLGVLVGALKKAKQTGRSIIISGLKDNIKKLFLITGLDKLFIIEE